MGQKKGSERQSESSPNDSTRSAIRNHRSQVNPSCASIITPIRMPLTLAEVLGARLVPSMRDEVPMRETRFRATLAFALGALIAQFLLGMAVNLFVTIPTDHPGANRPEYFGGVVASVSWAILPGGLWLTLHAAWDSCWCWRPSARWYRRSACAVADGSRWRHSV